MSARKMHTFRTALIGSDGSTEEAKTSCYWDPSKPDVLAYVAETAAAMRSAASARHGGSVKFSAAAPSSFIED